MHSLRQWDSSRFADRLTALISKTGLSQQDLAELANVSHSQISRWKNGQHRPAYDNLARLHDAITRKYPDAAPITAQMLDAAGYETAADPDVLPGFTAEETRIARAFIDRMRARNRDEKQASEA